MAAAPAILPDVSARQIQLYALGSDSKLYAVRMDETTGSLLSTASLVTGDIEIGAVELKNGTDDTRAIVTASNALKVDGSAVTQPVSIATAPVLVAGAAIIGKVGVDQTTPGTTNAVSLAQLGATTIATGNGVVGAGVLRVAIASDTSTVPVSLASVPSHAVTNAGTFAVQAVITAASGALASGSLAAGAMVDLVANQTPIAAGAATATKGLLLGGQFDTTQKTLTNGQQAALSASARGALFVAVGADGFAVTNAGTFATQSAITAASGSIVSGAIAAGAQVDLLTMRGTVAAGTAAANSLLTGGVFNSTAPTLTTGQQAAKQLDSAGSLQVNSEGKKATYRVAVSSVGVTAAGVLLSFNGSATKTIRILSLRFTAFLTTAASLTAALYRTTGAVSAASGTTALTKAKLSTANANSVADAVANIYTASTIGAGSIQLGSQKGMAGSATVLPTTFQWDFGTRNGQGMVLSGTGDFLQLYQSTGIYTGASFDVELEWTEE